MNIFNHKKLIAAVALGSVIAFGGNFFYDTAFAAGSTTKSDSKIQNSKGSVEWDKGDVFGIGFGRKDPRGLAMSREAAVMAAQRDLVGVVQGMQIDSDTTMRDLEIESDFVHRKISGILRGAQIVEEHSTEDGGYYVKMRVPIYGVESIASAITYTLAPEKVEPFEKVKEPSITPAEVKKLASNEYSGVVIDASGLGLEPTFSPVIYDTNGRAVYGVKNLDPDKIIERGMVSYSYSVKDEITVERVGNNPLIVKAVRVNEANTSASRVNAIVSVEDADKILLANEKSHMLEECAVAFVR